MATSARELELEDALRTLISYVRALPMVPATYHAIADAERSLFATDRVEAFEAVKPPPAGKWNMLGMHPVAARLFGNTLLVTTTDVRSKPGLIQEFKDDVYDELIRGFLVRIKPEFIRPSPIFDQFIGPQRDFHQMVVDAEQSK